MRLAAEGRQREEDGDSFPLAGTGQERNERWSQGSHSPASAELLLGRDYMVLVRRGQIACQPASTYKGMASFESNK